MLGRPRPLSAALGLFFCFFLYVRHNGVPAPEINCPSQPLVETDASVGSHETCECPSNQLLQSPSLDFTDELKTKRLVKRSDDPGTVLPEGEDVKTDVVPRLLQASMLSGYEPGSPHERCLETHVRHGERWGHPTHVLRQNLVPGYHNGAFNKAAHLLNIIMGEVAKDVGRRSEWIFWLDADTIVLNPEIPKTLFLPPDDFAEVYFLGPKDWEGFNAGGFFIRVNDWSIKMLTETMALPLFKPEVDLGFSAVANAMKHVFEKPEYRDHVLYQPRRWYNDFRSNERPEAESGSLLVHFDGTLDENSEAIKPWLDAIEQSPSSWQVPVQDTSFPKEVDKYWRNMRLAKMELANFIPNVTESEEEWDSENHDMVDLAAARVSLWWAVREHAHDSGLIESLLQENEELRKRTAKRDV